MAVTHGLYTTYDSQYLKDDIRGLAVLVEPKLTTSWDLLPELDPADGPNGKTSVNLEWFDAVRYDLNGANRGGWNNSDTTGLGVDDALAVIVQIGDVLRINDEYVVVSAVSNRTSGNGAISVHARGHGSSSAATHLNGDAITIVGNGHVEGTVDITGVAEDTIKRTNYFSLVEEQVRITKTGENQAYEDIEDQVDFQKQAAMNRALKKINRSVFYGLKAQGSASTPRTTGGLEEFVNSTTYGAVRVNAGGGFTEGKLQTLLKTIALRGGMPNVILMSPLNKQIANGFNNNYVQTTRQDSQAGVLIDTYLDQNVGEVRFVSDLSMRDDVVFAINTNKCGKMWFLNDELRFVRETNVNSRLYVETLQGQYSFMFKDVASDFGVLYGIA